MAHNLDITSGAASFVSAREDAWHQLGITLDSSFTAEEAMQYGRLGGWNVRKTPLSTNVEGVGEILVPEQYAVVRNNPVEQGRVDVLGTVGENYVPVQNEAHADLLNALVDEAGAHFETAGAIDGGRRVFVTMKLPGHMSIGGRGGDRVDTYIAAVNSHDGSMAFTFMVTPVRIVCQNTLNVALGSAAPSFKVRHTSGATNAITARAREALELTFNYTDEFEEIARRLVDTPLSADRFDQIITGAFGPAEGAAAATVTRTENKLDEMRELFITADTQSPIRDTAWAGFNALTEWFDHFSPTRGSEEERELSRATKAVMYPAFKQTAAALFLQEAELVGAS